MGRKRRAAGSAGPAIIAWVLADLVVIWASFLTAHWIRYVSGLYKARFELGLDHFVVLAVVSLTWISLFALGGLYRTEFLARGMDQVFALVRWVSLGVLLLLLAAFISKTRYFVEGRLVLLFAWGFSLAGLSIYRLAVARAHRARLEWIPQAARVLILGAGDSGHDFAIRLRAERRGRVTIVGYLDDDPAKIGHEVGGDPVLASTAMVELIAREEEVDEIFVAIPSLTEVQTVNLVSRCMRAGVPVRIVSNSFRLLTTTTEVEMVGGVPTVHLRESGLAGSGAFMKRALDIVVSVTLLIVLAPLFLLIALFILALSGRPVIFRQTRAGRDGRPFTLLKFRTMRDEGGDEIHRRYATALISGEDLALTDARSKQPIFKPPEDPRVTPIGRILRKTSLDELPQLVNVVKGEMSLVGPRPPILYELNYYQEWHRHRLSVRPGVTGMWQVHGRSRVPFDDMVILDLYYIEHWSFMNDLKLLARTIPVVIFGKGAY